MLPIPASGSSSSHKAERTEGGIAPENRKGPTAFAVRPCTFWLPGTDLNRQPSDKQSSTHTNKFSMLKFFCTKYVVQDPEIPLSVRAGRGIFLCQEVPKATCCSSACSGACGT